MNFARAHNTYLEPPDDDPICEDGCGQTLTRDITGVWVCDYKFCPTKFQGVEKEMAEALVDALDELDTAKRKVRMNVNLFEDAMRRLAEVDAILYEFQNNPEMELGEKAHAKIHNYFLSLGK